MSRTKRSVPWWAPEWLATDQKDLEKALDSPTPDVVKIRRRKSSLRYAMLLMKGVDGELSYPKYKNLYDKYGRRKKPRDDWKKFDSKLDQEN
jgi:hypothetical protein